MPDSFDVIIIGSGPGGYVCAIRAAQLGLKVACVEKRATLGGTCLNIGCIPSKALLQSSEEFHHAAHALKDHGVLVDSVKLDLGRMLARKDEVVSANTKGVEFLFRKNKVTWLKGTGRIVGPGKVDVDGTMYDAKHIVIATGSESVPLAGVDVDEKQIVTSTGGLELDTVPGHLVVIGGGYIGLELAQAMRRFGSQVTVIEHGSQLASREDADVGAALLELFHDEGIEVLLESAIAKVEGRSGDKVRVHVKGAHGERAIEGSDLLVATGRMPNTEAAGLELAGVELDERGFIKVNDRLETTAAKVWAMGDCAGSPQFTHAAYNDFRVVHANLTGGKRSTKNRLVPFCMFTDPELARVGRNELEAKRDGIEYRVAKMPMTGVLRTRTISEPRGFMKMLIGKDSDEIIGFTAFGAEASELMAAVQTAMAGRMPFTVLRDAIFTHPTISEGLVFLLEQLESRVS